MEKLEGKTAVVTGAASGIGLGMVEALAHRGMHVVMADIEEAPLVAAAERLQRANLSVSHCVADVSQLPSVEQLLERAVQTCERVHVLCNNAGVAGGGAGPIWEATANDWEWVMGVNLYGVVNGLKVFVPHMLQHGEAGHVVNTSSILGLTSGAGSIYGVTKHAVARLSEGLYHDLQNAEANIGVTLLCPGLIATNIITSGRNRPEQLRDDREVDPDREALLRQREGYFKNEGMPPREVGEMVADAVQTNRFYLLTHPENMDGVRRRFDDVLSRRQPTPAGRIG